MVYKKGRNGMDLTISLRELRHEINSNRPKLVLIIFIYLRTSLTQTAKSYANLIDAPQVHLQVEVSS